MDTSNKNPNEGTEMRTNVALCSLNPVVGALDANVDRIFAAYEDAARRGADIVLTPEMSLTGYPLEDLTQRSAFLRDVEKARARLCGLVLASGHEATIVFGHPTDAAKHDGNRRLVYNSATVYDPTNGSTDVVHKRELPNYGVFDEKRNYLEGPQPRVVRWRGLRLGMLICEDGWFDGVTDALAYQGADMLLWMNGSPFETGKNVKRREHADNRLAKARVPLAYVNLVGGQDELVFDGDCFAFDGTTYQQSRLFVESSEMATFDVERGQATRHAGSEPYPKLPAVTPTDVSTIYGAIVLGLRDYVGKSGFRKVVIGYSGGVDSGLVAALAADAFGPRNVLLVRLPSKYSDDASKDDAWIGAERLGCPMRTVNIEPIVQMTRDLYAGMTFDMNEALPTTTPVLTGVSDENIQARARANILMAISNQEGFMLLNTSNKSECMVGFSSILGDLAGGFSPLKDCLKTMVWALCRHRNSMTEHLIERAGYLGPVGEVVPADIVSKEPSAGLKPDQVDTDSLPPYTTVLDPLIVAMVDEESPTSLIVRHIADRATTLSIQNKVYGSEYKRRLGAPGIKIGKKLLGRDRRYSIVNAYRDMGDEE
jgi:NAD+ synthase